MKNIKKLLCLFLCACMLFAFTACSTVNTTPVFSYEDAKICSDYYSFVLSYEKGYYTALFKNYYGVDLDAQTSYWDNEITEGKKLADSVLNDINEYCKMILICNYLCDKHDIQLTEDASKEVEDNLQLLQDKNGGEDMFVVELAKLGCNKDTVKKFLTDTAKMDLLRDYLYGENGTQKVPAADIEKEFFKSYKKVDSMSISFNKYDEGGAPTLWKGDFTDNEITDYFLKEFRNTSYLFFEQGKNESDEDYKARVTKVFDSIKSGEKKFDDVKGDSDTNYADWPVSYGDVSDKFLEEIDKLSLYSAEPQEGETNDISKCVAMLEDEEGLHIFIRKPISKELLKDAEKEDCVKAMSAKHISDYADDYFEKVKSGEIEFGKELKTDFYSVYVPDNIFVDSDMDEAFLKKYNDTKDGEYFIYTTDTGIFVCRRRALDKEDINKEYTDSYYGTKSTYYKEIETKLVETAFYDYLNTYYDSIVINNDELKKYDIRTAAKFGGDLWG